MSPVRGLVVVALVAVALWLVTVTALLAAGRLAPAREVALLVPHLLSLLRGLLRDPRVPRSSKAVVLLAAVWIASPIDLVPEFVPVLGPLDDALVAVLALGHVLRRAGEDVVAEHWRGDPATLQRLLGILRARHAGP
jgi:uncharacterized membrane protein YkvA (DUF1232 family)